MTEQYVTLDVREDLRNGREPFLRIMQAVGALQPGQALRLIAPFEPVPLYGVLGQQGFSHQTQPQADGSFEVLFSPKGERPFAAPPAPPECPGRPRTGGGKVVEVDARGLEPPQPMMKILEALTELPAGAALRAHTDRRPMHLYPQLEQRGFVGESQEQSDGSFITHIRRR